MTTLKIVYVLFLGVLLAAFVGLGISAFYPSPKSPDFNTMAAYKIPPPEGSTETAKLNEQQQKFQEKQVEYSKKLNIYNQNVSLLAIGFSIIILIVSILSYSRILILSDGALLGGLLTLGYGIIRGFSSNDSMFRFMVVAAGLLIALVLGYIKFIKTSKKKK